ncbi:MULTISPECIES: MotE family protein [unclassified Paenibacillus]|uniref:MotE family protein n=1 Tax=unclassified Paenibacillus TaxID=185978 RepID=UPI001E592FEC|nr:MULTISPECIES: primosomal protein [unclassified Paenibacillus]CAH0119811.1 hypothetical protein PAE9249_02319 [Paenibacillus sp. CECT 9249]
MAEADVEKSSFGGFERFLFFITPIIFTIVLLVVLLTLFNYPLRHNLLEFASKIPIVNQWVPAPAQEADPKGTEESEMQTAATEATVRELKQLLAAKNAELEQAIAATATKESEAAELQTKIDALEKQFDQKKQTDEQYVEQINALAGMYAKISPSKAAPILENLTMDELVLVLHAMRTDDRVRVLEKMNPKVAADASIRLKDVEPAENMAIAALQSRISRLEAEAKKPSNTLDSDQLSKTFMAMTPKSAATLVLDTAKISQDKALSILKSVDDATRSRILGAMSEGDSSDEAAKLLAKLLPAK